MTGCALRQSKSRRWRRGARWALGAVVLATILLHGCGRYAGLAYFLGAGRDTKIEPLYALPEGKLLILVDDPSERVIWPRARDLLERYLGEELLRHEAVTAVVNPTSVARFRQADSRFERYPATRIGRMLEADTVIWLEVRDFFAPINIEDSSVAAKMTIAVRVLTTDESPESGRSRLWPTDESGHLDTTKMTALDVHKLEGDNAVARELARRSAIRIGRLFFQHTVGEVDDEDV